MPTNKYILTKNYEKLSAVLGKVIKERDQAVEYLSMRMENLKENGKTILDFQAVWISQARSTNERLLEKVSTLETKLSECETLKRGYYDEAVKGWEKFRELERKINEKEIREERLVKEAYMKKEK